MLAVIRPSPVLVTVFIPVTSRCVVARIRTGAIQTSLRPRTGGFGANERARARWTLPSVRLAVHQTRRRRRSGGRSLQEVSLCMSSMPRGGPMASLQPALAARLTRERFRQSGERHGPRRTAIRVSLSLTGCTSLFVLTPTLAIAGGATPAASDVPSGSDLGPSAWGLDLPMLIWLLAAAVAVTAGLYAGSRSRCSAPGAGSAVTPASSATPTVPGVRQVTSNDESNGVQR